MRLVAQGLAYGYPKKPVGRDITLALETGQILALLGPNGSGKSTLLKTLLGLLKPQGGGVTVGGVDIRCISRASLARMMAYVPQAHVAYFPFTVLDTVLMARTAHMGLFSTPRTQDRNIAFAALEALGIVTLANDLYTLISGGERQLVLIARALAQESRLLLMDEPTASLDFGNQIRLLEHVRLLARRGIGILLSTHDPNQVLAFADRVALLHEGTLVQYGAPHEIVTRESLRLLYGVDVDVISVPGSHHPICVPTMGRAAGARPRPLPGQDDRAVRQGTRPAGVRSDQRDR